MLGVRKNKNGCFDCDKCPRTNDPQADRYCVAWWEGVEENVATGEARVYSQCGFTVMPRLLSECAGANRSAAAAVESMRNEVVRLVTATTQQTIVDTVRQIREEAAPRQITNGSG